MATLPFEIILSGDAADEHEMPAYDGFSSLAGVSLATTLITNYALTGKIRRRGHFEARSNVRFTEYREGSLVFGFLVEYAVSHPWVWQLGATAAGGVATNALYDLIKHTIKRNIGQFHEPESKELETLIDKKGGDLEALAAAVEPSLRQGHNIIGRGARKLDIRGKRQREISTFDAQTKDYISKSVEEDEILEKDVTVAAFNANTGHGRVYDSDLGHTVALYIPEGLQSEYRRVIGWGLNEYSKGSGRKISLKFTRVVALDGRPKKYIVLEAIIPRD